MLVWVGLRQQIPSNPFGNPFGNPFVGFCRLYKVDWVILQIENQEWISVSLRGRVKHNEAIYDSSNRKSKEVVE